MQPATRHGSQREPQEWQAVPCLRRAWVVMVGLVLVMMSGCIQPIQPRTPTPALPALDLSQASTNRLLVLSTNGNLFTVNPDGAARLDLTADADPRHFYSQPTWSPTGERIAWAEVNAAPGELS